VSLSIKDEVVSIVEQLSRDELRVFRYIGQRMLRLGRNKYGALDLANESRTWTREMAEEQSDRLFYDGCREVATEDRKAERLECFKHDRAYGSVDAALTSFVQASTSDTTPVEATFEIRDGQLFEIVPPGAEVLP
jgi:hypothetical protein